jgi:hypothetical protein
MEFLRYGYSAMIGRVPLFISKEGFELWQKPKIRLPDTQA